VASLLERENELVLLAEAVEAAAGGRGCAVLVAGEAGIGKTTLVRALRERVAGRAEVLVGACEPLSVPIPLAPLRELAEKAGAAELLGDDDRLAIARELLRLLAGRAPTLAVIEDIHWADPLTVDVLRILLRRVEEVGIVLVATYRDDEVAANPALSLLLGDLATSPAVTRIALAPLSDDAVRELAGPDWRELARATGGNPFLVVESVAAGGQLPATVRDAALARAGRLSSEARKVVDAAAVIGQRVDPELLRDVVENADAIDEALSRGVLVADGPELGFRHELIREALESSIPPPRRRDLHARVLAALTAEPGAADNARLAHHAELGGLTADAARYAALAAAEAERMGALREARLQADRALRLGGDDLDPAQRLDLLLRYSRAANFSSPRLEDAVVAAEQAVELASDPAGKGRALITLASASWSLERVVEARTAAEQAVAAFESVDDREGLARAYSSLLRIEATSFDPEVAIELAERVPDLQGLDDVRIEIAITLGLAKGHRGDTDALAVLADAGAAARREGLAIPMVRNYVNTVYVAMAQRRHEDIDRVTPEALTMLDEYNTPLPATAIEGFRARSLLDRGRWDEALAVAASDTRILPGESPMIRASAGLIRARRGNPAGVGEIEEAWEDLRSAVSAEGARHCMVRLALVEAAWLRGDRDAAVAQLEEARAAGVSSRFARPGGELALWGSRYGIELDVPQSPPEPVRLELEGDWRGAIRAWRDREAPYEAALAALPGDDQAARDALLTLHHLGADAAVVAFKRERSERGTRPARGPRPSTLANPAGLTRREQEVLRRVAGGETNAAIAAGLHLSTRTVAHHMTAILRKLDAPNRVVAIERARAQGLLAQDGTATPPS
jgi:DNA-binding CsgD family transcriptional regulator/tetratricopeptide (TPR) repeat protein